MIRTRAYKTALAPTEEQQHALNRIFGACRYVWNWGLAQRRECWEKTRDTLPLMEGGFVRSIVLMDEDFAIERPADVPAFDLRPPIRMYEPEGTLNEARKRVSERYKTASKAIERGLPTEIVDAIATGDAGGVFAMIHKALGGAVPHAILFAYGLRIEAFRAEYKPPTFFEQCKRLTALKQQEDTAWLSEIPSNALQATLQNLDRAFQAFFRRVKQGGAPGYPRFKGRHRGSGFKFFAPLKISEGRIWLPSAQNGVTLGWIPFAEPDRAYFPEGEFKGKPRKTELEGLPLGERWFLSGSVTERHGKTFVSVTVAEHYTPLESVPERTIAVHFGLRVFATVYDGGRYYSYEQMESKNDRKRIKVYEEKIALLQMKQSKMKRGSREYGRLGRRISKYHKWIADTRKSNADRLTTRIIETHRPDRIILEKWDVQGMMQDKRLAKSIAEASWFEHRLRVAYKAKWMGATVVELESQFPSSRTCSRCGSVEKENDGKRMFECSACGLRRDREVNAVKNIYNAASKINEEAVS